MVAGLASIVGVLIAGAAALATFMPGQVTAFEGWVTRHPWRFRAFFVGVFALTGWGAYEQRQESQALNAQLNTLVAASATQATAEDVRGLRQEVRDGFVNLQGSMDRVASAIVAGALVTTTTTTTSPSQTTTSTSPPPILRHLRFTEQRIPSDKPESPYGLRVIIQTDISTQPTSLQLQFDGPIDNGTFFVTGQGIMMNVLTTRSSDGRTFGLSFAFPPWTPASPIVVTIYSKGAVRVTGLAAP